MSATAASSGACAAPSWSEHVPPCRPTMPNAWQKQWHEWKLRGTLAWIVTGVHPPRRDALVGWLSSAAIRCTCLTSAKQLPLAVESSSRTRSASIVCSTPWPPTGSRRNMSRPSSSMRVRRSPWIASMSDGVFRGGAIFPGFRLMAQALHDYTALLPLIVEIDDSALPPGRTTACTPSGRRLLRRGRRHRTADRRHTGHRLPTAFEIFLTGGDAALLHQCGYRATSGPR